MKKELPPKFRTISDDPSNSDVRSAPTPITLAAWRQSLFQIFCREDQSKSN